ncbi:hypothetical protein QBC40DRAFT_284348 [Triangularia verruculosa]|uniref:Uncharacterized protein n=1 Tax=Triangularia verruculosa TaxID=2587418 RepID=A0AAN6XDH7_9PEZI|nr:hypothetical protein QBC40DRAFT_284348 [Triangularia verruculosa]
MALTANDEDTPTQLSSRMTLHGSALEQADHWRTTSDSDQLRSFFEAERRFVEHNPNDYIDHTNAINGPVDRPAGSGDDGLASTANDEDAPTQPSLLMTLLGPALEHADRWRTTSSSYDLEIIFSVERWWVEYYLDKYIHRMDAIKSTVGPPLGPDDDEVLQSHLNHATMYRNYLLSHLIRMENIVRRFQHAYPSAKTPRFPLDLSLAIKVIMALSSWTHLATSRRFDFVCITAVVSGIVGGFAIAAPPVLRLYHGWQLGEMIHKIRILKKRIADGLDPTPYRQLAKSSCYSSLTWVSESVELVDVVGNVRVTEEL